MNEWNSQPGNAETYAQAVLALRETMALATHPNVDVSAVLYWPARISDTFLQYIMERKPQALVILAYYCAFIQQFQDFWWIRNRGEHDLRIIREVLVDAGEMAWNAWLDEPFRIIQEQNQHPMQISGMVAPFPI
ncbi:hypothetical protein DL96DRAFT_1702198 [Flagelloscypha sp. PMI_526]|nr:hypothetical protein DL96DRAFT_1702198 [Flagelloscypha sp. PMI_526]